MGVLISYRWKKYFFSIKKGKLFWYDDEKARRAEGSIKISEIKSVEIVEKSNDLLGNITNISSVADVANMGLGIVGLQGQKFPFDIVIAFVSRRKTQSIF